MQVDYRFMGTTGLKVSSLCLGFMSFEQEGDEAVGHAVADRFVEAGGNFIDTADIYGVSEEILGRWLEGQSRDDLVISTKVRWPSGGGVNDAGLSRKHILAAVEASLRRLRTDYIDLYQVHGWDSAGRLEETLHTLNGLVEAGKVRYLGVSNYTGWQLQKAIDLSRANGWEPFTCMQPLYNLLDREAEWELLPVAREEGLGVIPWSPLRGGWLAGKYRRGSSGPAPGSRLESATRDGASMRWDAYDREETWRVLDVVHAIADETGTTAAQVAVNWVLGQPTVTSPTIGARSPEQLDDLLRTVDWSLTDDQLARLTGASDRPLPYPYWHASNQPRV